MNQYLKCQICNKEEGEEEIEFGARRFWACEECIIGATPNSENEELNKQIIKNNETWLKNYK